MFPSFLENIDIGFWVLQTIAMMLTCFLLPRLEVSGPLPALLTVIVLAFINAHFWDAALFFNIPDDFTIRTLTLVATNAVIFFIVVKLLPGIDIRGVLPAVLAPLIFTVTSSLLKEYASHVDWVKVFHETSKWIVEWRNSFQAPKPQ